MIYERFNQIERKTWRKWLFYIDIIIIAIFVISLVFLAEDAYYAGFYYGGGKTSVAQKQMWYVVRDASFITATLAWLFYRFFRNQFLLLRRIY
ncbi:MAG: hypothetical protein DRN16_01675 [Thermoplasmata archaeon]|nr:MAG: hypothetical protein DRN16_01675 [Thermoplasmata archaeon]